MTHLALNGNTVVFALFFIALAIIVSIVGLRYYWKYKLSNPVSRSDNSPLKNTGGLHAFGICIALLTMITLMSWTQAERAVHSYTPEYEDFGEVIEIPRTAIITRKPKPIPTPTKPNPIIVEVEDLVEVEKPKEIPIEVPIDVPVVESEDAVIATPAPVEPPPLPAGLDDDFVDNKEFVIVERMPRFPGCESQDLTMDEKYECSERELMIYIAHNLKYPTIARENGVEGKVFVEFVVNKNGDLTKIKVIRDIGAGCGGAAQKVISDMVKENGLWKPGMQRGRNVNVKYTIPITFKLSH